MPTSSVATATFVFGFQDNIYVEYAKVTKGDTPSEYSKYESGTSVAVSANKSIYYKIYSLLENKNDKITFYNPHSPDSDAFIEGDYLLVVPENEIISVNGVDWILRNHFGFNGEDMNVRHNYGIRIERPDPPGINFKYPNAPKFRNQVTPHVYFGTVETGKLVPKDYSIPSPFSKNIAVKTHTEYSAHVGEIAEFEANGLSRNSVFTVDISKTLFDKETDDEPTSDFPDSPIFDGPIIGGKM